MLDWEIMTKSFEINFVMLHPHVKLTGQDKTRANDNKTSSDSKQFAWFKLCVC